MKNYYVLILFLLLPCLTFAQKNLPERLKDSLKFAQTDSSKHQLSEELIRYYSEISIEICLAYIEEGIKLDKKNQKTLDLAEDLSVKGYELMHLNKASLAYSFLQEAKTIAEDPANENKYRKSTVDLPNINICLNALANIHHELGNLMGVTGNTRQQIAEYREELVLGKQSGSNELIPYVNMNLGNIYLNYGKLDSALLLEKNAATTFEHLADNKYLGAVYSIIGDIYSKENNDKLALNYYHKAAIINLVKNNLTLLAKDYLNLSNYYIKKIHPDSSLYFARKGMLTAMSMQLKRLSPFYSSLYKSYKLTHTPDSVSKYMELALLSADSSNKSTAKNLSDFQQLSFKTQLQLNEIEKQKEVTKSRNKVYELLVFIALLILLALIFYRNNRQEQKINHKLNIQKEEIASQRDQLNETLIELKNAQSLLIHSEKMVSLGELTAGIAHEIQNPLNFVNNFSEVNTELIDEMQLEIEKGDYTEVKTIAANIKGNQQKISTHGKRADFIVKGMLQHSRTSTGEKQETNINLLADEFLKLSYLGLRAKDKSFNAELLTDFAKNLPQVFLARQNIGRVLLNLFNNAFYPVNQKQKTAGADYKPEVTLTTSIDNNNLLITVKDNGNGIPDAIKDKIMQPFFTTKPAGEGTGLGLSLSYDIIKAHRENILVNTKEGASTEFILTLPIN